MKGTIPAIFIALLILGSACETETDRLSCLPQLITRTMAQGTNATAITADYKYVDDQLDYIIWSNYQTHYFRYNETGQLSTLTRKNVQTYQKLESRLVYEGDLVLRSDEYSISLDRFTQEDSDTTYTGYKTFEYDGDKITSEEVYIMNPGTQGLEMEAYKEYEYDLSGNMIKYVCLDGIQGDTIEAFSYAYDLKRNIYSSLKLPFEGKTYVNNIIQTTDLLSGDVLFHQIVYSPTNFPEQVVIKQDSYLTEVIRVDYTCK